MATFNIDQHTLQKVILVYASGWFLAMRQETRNPRAATRKTMGSEQPHHFPMQKLLKMASRTSSPTVSPVISPSALAAAVQSIVTSSAN